jgi:hypothetical protein
MSNVYSLDQVRAAKQYERAIAEWEGAPFSIGEPQMVTVDYPSDYADDADASGWMELAGLCLACFGAGALATVAVALVLSRFM